MPRQGAALHVMESAMLRERIEGKWIACFAQVFRLCGVKAGESAAIPARA